MQPTHCQGPAGAAVTSTAASVILPNQDPNCVQMRPKCCNTRPEHNMPQTLTAASQQHQGPLLNAACYAPQCTCCRSSCQLLAHHIPVSCSTRSSFGLRQPMCLPCCGSLPRLSCKASQLTRPRHGCGTCSRLQAACHAGSAAMQGPYCTFSDAPIPSP
jgi:hypothetical protein